LTVDLRYRVGTNSAIDAGQPKVSIVGNDEQLAILKNKHVVDENNWREAHSHLALDLSAANLRRADLLGADLTGNRLCETTFANVDLRGATGLSECSFSLVAPRTWIDELENCPSLSWCLRFT
jgi:hypothetical protein